MLLPRGCVGYLFRVFRSGPLHAVRRMDLPARLLLGGENAEQMLLPRGRVGYLFRVFPPAGRSTPPGDNDSRGAGTTDENGAVMPR